MLRIGYLTAMVPPEALDEEVDRLANILAGNAPQAMAGMKRAINEFARGKLDEPAADQRHRESMRGAEIKGVQGAGGKAGAEVLNFKIVKTTPCKVKMRCFLTSPRLRGRRRSHQRCDPGEGVQVYR